MDQIDIIKMLINKLKNGVKDRDQLYSLSYKVKENIYIN